VKQANDDPKSLGFVDVVLLAVKGWQVPGAVETIRPLMGPPSPSWTDLSTQFSVDIS
jgi:ketopantoate reductase